MKHTLFFKRWLRIPKSIIIVFFIVLNACSEDENRGATPETVVLTEYLAEGSFTESSVIACAGNNGQGTAVNVYFYPRPGVSNVRYFETTDAAVAPNDYDNYVEATPDSEALFNGYLRFFKVSLGEERYVIVTFEEDGVVNVSNPIRLKLQTQPTEYLPQNVALDNQTVPRMPIFSWVDGTFQDSVIYFHVVSTENDELLSGTYTFERFFQYYNLDNVVLNITEDTPPELELGVPYNFTLLAVTEDNWVNLFSEIEFTLQE